MSRPHHASSLTATKIIDGPQAWVKTAGCSLACIRRAGFSRGCCGAARVGGRCALGLGRMRHDHFRGDIRVVGVLRLALELRVDLSGHRVGAERAPEQQDVRFRSVARIVSPAARLLDADAAPLGLTEHPVLREALRELLWQNDLVVMETKETQKERSRFAKRAVTRAPVEGEGMERVTDTPAWTVRTSRIRGRALTRAPARTWRYSNESSWYFSEYSMRPARSEVGMMKKAAGRGRAGQEHGASDERDRTVPGGVPPPLGCRLCRTGEPCDCYTWTNGIPVRTKRYSVSSWNNTVS